MTNPGSVRDHISDATACKNQVQKKGRNENTNSLAQPFGAPIPGHPGGFLGGLSQEVAFPAFRVRGRATKIPIAIEDLKS